MDNDSLSALEKLKQLKTAKKPELGLDPNIFFTQLPQKESVVQIQESQGDELFGSTNNNEVVESNSSLSEDDLFGGEPVNIIPSDNIEKIIETKEAKIADIEKALAATKFEVPGATKPETETTNQEYTTVNGVKKYVMKEEDKPAQKITKATKAIRKAPHNSKELDDVDLLEKVLISLMLNNIKK